MPWVDRIFSKLTARYGRDFLSKYEGVDLDLVKSDWAEELAGLQNRPEAIKYALDHPTAKPPNVIEFKDTCSRSPVQTYVAIDAPKPDPSVVNAALRKAKEAVKPQHDVLFPIRRLMWREIEGDKRLTKAQREFWRIALHDEIRKACGMNTKERIDMMELSKALHHMRVET